VSRASSCSGTRRCIFHDENYLKGDNYGKHREEVARRFEKKLSESSLEFIGYCLPNVPLRTSRGYFVDYTADTAILKIFASCRKHDLVLSKNKINILKNILTHMSVT
jgi:hypothetical protein